MTEELLELLRVYERAEEQVLEKEKDVLYTLEVFMNKYLELKNERCGFTKKKEDLRNKLGLDDEQEEQEDEE